MNHEFSTVGDYGEPICFGARTLKLKKNGGLGTVKMVNIVIKYERWKPFKQSTHWSELRVISSH